MKKYISSTYLKDVSDYTFKLFYDKSKDYYITVKKVNKIKEPFILEEESREVKIRIIEHKFFEKTDNKETVLSYEFPNNWTKRKEAYYPINDEKNNELYCKYKELAQKEKNLYLVGD
jgi:UDP-galactopyranose mutase